MVREVLERHDDVEVHPHVFRREIPTSSLPAHLHLRAVKLLEDAGMVEGGGFERLMWALQLAFFRDLRDISKRQVLDDIAEGLDIPSALVAEVIDDGRAFAELARDAALQRKHDVRMTPSLVQLPVHHLAEATHPRVLFGGEWTVLEGTEVLAELSFVRGPREHQIDVRAR